MTINSDDPPMFGTTLNREYEIAAGMLDLDARGVADLALEAVDASFAPDQVRAQLRAEIEAYVSSQDPTRDPSQDPSRDVGQQAAGSTTAG